MANPKIRLSGDSFRAMLGMLAVAEEDQTDNEFPISAIVKSIRETAVLSDVGEIVEMQLAPNMIAQLISILAPAYDDMPEDTGVMADDYGIMQEIIEARTEKQRKLAAAQEAKEKYEKWLYSAVSKYVSDESLSCKDIAVLINNNDLQPGQERLKYQSIMRVVKDLRSKG